MSFRAIRDVAQRGFGDTRRNEASVGQSRQGTERSARQERGARHGCGVVAKSAKGRTRPLGDLGEGNGRERLLS